MKKVLVFFAGFTILSMGAFARPPASEHTIRLADGSAFDVTINDWVFNDRQSVYTIGDLSPGRQFVRIVHYPQIFVGRRMVEGTPRVIFSGHIMIPAQTSISGFIDFNGRFVETHRFAMHSRDEMRHRDRNRGRDRDRDFGRNRDGRWEDRDWDDRRWENDFHRRAMNQRDFSRLTMVLSEIPFENQRLEAAIQITRDNHITSEQLKSLWNCSPLSEIGWSLLKQFILRLLTLKTSS